MIAPLATVLIPIFIKEGKKFFEERDQKKNAKREARNESPTSSDLGPDSNLSAKYPHPAYVDNRSMQGHGKFQHDPRNYPGGQRHGGGLQQHGGLVNGRHASDYDHERYRADYNRNQHKSFRRAGHGRYEENGSDHDGFGGTHRHEHQNGQRTSRSSDEDRKPENCENKVGDSGRKDFHGSSGSEDEGDAKSSVDQKARDTSVSHKRRA
ncbi:hypothetical protein DL95DRAFT_417386 [Leptodontidium sp. 2 PMI_412]|nr:hypothetical protein DL95DRAFT_417386 [Leptodontidium sp. 2 PMI_412]